MLVSKGLNSGQTVLRIIQNYPTKQFSPPESELPQQNTPLPGSPGWDTKFRNQKSYL